MDCHFLLQGIFPSQGSNPGCIHCRQTLYHPSHQGSSVVSFLSVLILSVSLLCHLLDLSCAPTPCDPVDCSPPGSLSKGFPRQEYWSGWPRPSPGDLPDPGAEPVSLHLLAGGLFTTSPTWEVSIVSFGTFIQLFSRLSWRS